MSVRPQVQRVDEPVRLGGVSGLQHEQGPSNVETTRRTKPKTTAAELQQSAFPIGAAAAADFAAAAFQQLLPLLGLSLPLHCPLWHFLAAVLLLVQAIHTSVQFGHFDSLFK